MELTDERAKPAVYFGGKSRIIDFALSNALNSGIRRIGGRHAVQGAQPDPPSAARLEFLPPRAQRKLRHPARQPARLRGQWYLGTADAVYQNIDIIEATARNTSCCWPAITSTRWTTSRCCSSTSTQAPTSRSAAWRCRAPEASGFGVMHVDEHDRIIVVRGEAARIRRRCPASPDWRLPAWASTFRDEVPDRAAAAAMPPTRLQPRFRQGHHPLHRQARQGGGAPLREILRAVERRRRRPIGATSERSTPIGRPISTSPTSCPSSTSTTSNWPIWTYRRDHAAGQVRP